MSSIKISNINALPSVRLSGKIGIWRKDINKLYSIDDNKDYYSGE